MTTKHTATLWLLPNDPPNRAPCVGETLSLTAEDGTEWYAEGTGESWPFDPEDTTGLFDPDLETPDTLVADAVTPHAEGGWHVTCTWESAF